MILLASDTSGKQGSIALARASDDVNPADNSNVEIVEIVPLAGGTFSAQLVPEIAALLSKHGLTVRDVSAFAVASGPGSFTGLRVGLAAIKALAEVLQKPIAAVSLLEAVARSANSNGKAVALLEAGRGEIYVGEYDFADGAQAPRERLVTRDEFFSQPIEGVIATPDPRIAEIARNAGCPVELVPEPRSDTIARLGREKIYARLTVTPEELDANYIRRSDAEIFAKSNS
jgi:tRNA threonylcarbamoyladenosine biosynthesis protein TsaB